MQLTPKFQIEYIESNKLHIYKVGDQQFPSATQILSILDDNKSKNLIKWNVNLCVDEFRRLMELAIKSGKPISDFEMRHAAESAKQAGFRQSAKACDLGSQCHNAIDDLIRGNADFARHLVDEPAKISFGNFRNWLNANQFQFASGDLAVASLKYRFGGRLDAIAQDPLGNFIILDWKTSNHILSPYALQVGAYQQALFETYGILANRGFVVRFSKSNAEFEQSEVNLPKARHAFLHLSKIYHILQERNLFKMENPE